ncbi:MAG TPA: transporter [Candidatus Wunengus sp. YC60]|uniref:transporter n=1 Tax=Candidatus Wunengus sp. YC60 TaxID=3367697 RepID=UPI004029659B
MQKCIPMAIFLLSLWMFIQTISAFANDGKVVQDIKEASATNEIMKTREEHHGLQRNLGFSNFLEGWLTPWDAYEENENQAPRVPLLRITPAFFKREVRFNYIYVNDEHKGEADVNEWGMALELPLTLRFKVDIEPKILYVNTEEHDKHSGFGDTRVALRTMLLESNNFSLSTGSVISIPTGYEERKLGEGVTMVGQQLAFWIDLGHRISLHTFLGVDVPTGGKHREDADLDFLYGTALSKTFTIKETPVLEGITPFIELNGQKEFGLDKDEQYRVDLLPGVRWDLSHELYVMQGIEIPLNGADDFDKRVWFSIIKDL